MRTHNQAIAAMALMTRSAVIEDLALAAVKDIRHIGLVDYREFDRVCEELILSQAFEVETWQHKSCAWVSKHDDVGVGREYIFYYKHRFGILSKVRLRVFIPRKFGFWTAANQNVFAKFDIPLHAQPS